MHIKYLLLFSEAQDLLINWYEWTKVSYMVDRNKQKDDAQLYYILVNTGLSAIKIAYFYARNCLNIKQKLQKV